MRLPQYLPNRPIWATRRGKDEATQDRLVQLHARTAEQGRATLAAIERVVHEEPGIVTRDVAYRVHVSAGHVRKRLAELEHAGRIRRDRRGRCHPGDGL